MRPALPFPSPLLCALWLAASLWPRALAAHDLTGHSDLPFLAADCAGFWQARAAAAEAAARQQAGDTANRFLAAARELAPELRADLAYIADHAATRTGRITEHAGQNSAAARLLAAQAAECAEVGRALPGKWGLG